MNRIDKLFREKKENILSIYFTAGHPTLQSTVEIIHTLVEEGVDLIEIGIPFSDPVADGPVIQRSTQTALENGMSLKLLFEQLSSLRRTIDIPLILMGYLNPALQYGIDNFCAKCSEIGIDGTILPDLPLEIFQDEYEAIYKKYGIHNIFMATPQTSDERYIELDRHSGGFLYMVSSSSITGAKSGFMDYQQTYFERIKNLDLKLPRVIGFGISTRETFAHACRYANGAIIGSAFVNALDKEGDLTKNIQDFIRSIR